MTSLLVVLLSLVFFLGLRRLVGIWNKKEARRVQSIMQKCLDSLEESKKRIVQHAAHKKEEREKETRPTFWDRLRDE